MTRGKDPKIRVYKGKEQSDTTTNHRSLPSVNSNFSLVSTGVWRLSQKAWQWQSVPGEQEQNKRTVDQRIPNSPSSRALELLRDVHIEITGNPPGTISIGICALRNFRPLL